MKLFLLLPASGEVVPLAGRGLGASLELLSPLDDARFELAAVRRQRPGCSAAMLSMGGKSMQLGSEGRLVSLPFAMHLGHDLLKASPIHRA